VRMAATWTRTTIGMTTELEIRAGTAADTDRILELVRLSLGEGTIPREREYWEWKHHRNPFGESPVLLAETGGELVGLRVFMRWEWDAGGERLRAVRAVDTATHPAWQGKGIFSRLTKRLLEEMRREGTHFVFNTPNEKSRPGYLKMGWGAVGRVNLWIRPLRPLRVARAMLARTVGTGAAGAPLPPAAGEFRSVGELCDHPGLPALLEQARAGSGRSRLSTPRTPEYLRWRYEAIPGFRYHALFELDGRQGAAVVFRYKDQGPLLELRVCELLVGDGKGSEQMACKLLRRLQKAAGADYISSMAVARTPEQGALLRRGFLPAFRFGPVLTVRPLNPVPDGTDPLARDRWRLSIGDLELF
jgi:GNAT superfamily N-acetyltransferase